MFNDKIIFAFVLYFLFSWSFNSENIWRLIICNQLLTFTLPWSSQDTGTIDFWSPTVLWTMFFFMSLSFFLLTLFWNLWIATGHKSMWIRRLAYFKILRTRLTMIASSLLSSVQIIWMILSIKGVNGWL